MGLYKERVEVGPRVALFRSDLKFAAHLRSRFRELRHVNPLPEKGQVMLQATTREGLQAVVKYVSRVIDRHRACSLKQDSAELGRVRERVEALLRVDASNVLHVIGHTTLPPFPPFPRHRHPC